MAHYDADDDALYDDDVDDEDDDDDDVGDDDESEFDPCSDDEKARAPFSKLPLNQLHNSWAHGPEPSPKRKRQPPRAGLTPSQRQAIDMM